MLNTIRRYYVALEKHLPVPVKNIVPVSVRIQLGEWIKPDRSVREIESRPPEPLTPEPLPPLQLRTPLALPTGQTHAAIFDHLSRHYFKDTGPMPEMVHYLAAAFDRFLLTLQLVPPTSGRLLEIGANPYFMTLLLQKFRQYDLTLVNFFGRHWSPQAEQVVVDPEGRDVHFSFDNFNVEEDVFPYADHAFDLVLLCEVLEHFTNDPLHALTQIKRILKPNGVLVLTTPNVARLENISRLISGENLYDPYSGYGPLGRHNREYTVHELNKLLQHAGFTVEEWFTSDVHANMADHFVPVDGFQHLLHGRTNALGQYIFMKAVSSSAGNPKKPDWLYRSYPASEMAE